jgi:hypothetical protein
MVYGKTAHNRTVYASPPVGGSGYGFARSIALLIPTQNLRHILPVLVLLRKPLYGLAKRRKQPERYVPCFRFSGYIGCIKIDFKKKGKNNLKIIP